MKAKTNHFIMRVVYFLILIGFFINTSYAKQTNEPINAYQYIISQINKKNYYEIVYSPSKQAAILDHDSHWTEQHGITATYINFKNHQIFDIAKDIPNLYPKWLDDSIAIIDIPCGTGCERQLIFIAPQTVVECPPSPTDKNGFSTTAPLAIDIKQGLYACYDYAGNIQINRLPHVIKVITPPPDAMVKQAKFIESDLVVTYQSIPGQN